MSEHLNIVLIASVQYRLTVVCVLGWYSSVFVFNQLVRGYLKCLSASVKVSDPAG